jgi:hypothetical protein
MPTTQHFPATDPLTTALRGFFKKSALALAVSVALATSSAWAAPAPASAVPAAVEKSLRLAADDETYVNAFLQSFSYCDAQLLADFWGVTPWEAKIRGGDKIVNLGGESQVWDYNMLPAIERYADTFPPPAEIAGCYYDNQTTYDYDDAVTVACWWEKNGHPAIDENAAKLVIGWWLASREDIPGILNTAVTGMGCPGAVG